MEWGGRRKPKEEKSRERLNSEWRGERGSEKKLTFHLGRNFVEGEDEDDSPDQTSRD
jgi:hypothetical protein